MQREKVKQSDVREKIRELLREEDLTIYQMVNKTGYERQWVEHAVYKLRDYDEVEIVRHETTRNGYKRSPVFRLKGPVSFPLQDVWRGLVVL